MGLTRSDRSQELERRPRLSLTGIQADQRLERFARFRGNLERLAIVARRGIDVPCLLGRDTGKVVPERLVRDSPLQGGRGLRCGGQIFRSHFGPEGGFEKRGVPGFTAHQRLSHWPGLIGLTDLVQEIRKVQPRSRIRRVSIRGAPEDFFGHRRLTVCDVGSCETAQRRQRVGLVAKHTAKIGDG